MARSGRVTLKMIAQATGYTINTVSHALNGKGDISPATALYIRQKAREMGYINDMAASSLRSGYTRTVALIFPNVANPFWALFLKCIDRELHRYHYVSLMMDTDEDSHLEYQAVQAAISHKVDGIILCPNQRNLEAVQLIEKNNVPYVLLGRRFPGRPMNYVVWDEESGGYQAASYLLGLGKRRILFVNGPRHISSSVERYSGYRRALEEHGIPLDPQLVVETDLSAAGDNQELKRVFHHPASFDAILAFSDFIAWEIMVLLKEQGDPRLGSLPIVGFDDIQSNLRIPVSFATVGMDKQACAQRAVEILISLIGKHPPQQPIQEILPTHLALHGMPPGSELGNLLEL